MKIGIITWYDHLNYGGTLQAYAMSEFIRENGHTPEFINYKKYNKPVLSKMLRKVKNIAFLLCYPRRYFSRSKIKRFIGKNLVQSNEFHSENEIAKYANANYDMVICGSDQIWSTNGGDPVYFLSFFNSDEKKIAYAPSMGVIDLSNEFYWQTVSCYIKSIPALSVREMEMVAAIYNKTGKTATVVADPTLLFDAQYWRKLAHKVKLETQNHKGLFIFCYFLTYNEAYVRAINAFASKKKAQIIYLTVSHSYWKIHRWKYPKHAVSIENFLAYIDSCDYFFTDSYHGMLFGTQFNKKMKIFKRFADSDIKSENSRVDGFIKTYHLESIYVDSNNLKKIFEENEIDYIGINKQLCDVRKVSREWLHNAIQSD